MKRPPPPAPPYAVLDAILRKPGITTDQLYDELAGGAAPLSPAAVDGVLLAMRNEDVIKRLVHGGVHRHHISGTEDYAWSLEMALADIERAAGRIRRAAGDGRCTPDDWARMDAGLSAVLDDLRKIPLPSGAKEEEEEGAPPSRTAGPRESAMGEIRGHLRYGFDAIPAQVKRAERINRRLASSEARIRRSLGVLLRGPGKAPHPTRQLWNKIIAERRDMQETAAEMDDCMDGLESILRRGQPAVFNAVLRRLHGGGGVVAALGSAVEVVGNDTNDYEEEENEYYGDGDYGGWNPHEQDLKRLEAYRALQQIRGEIKTVPRGSLAAALVKTGRLSRDDAEEMIQDAIMDGRLVETDAGLLVLSYDTRHDDPEFCDQKPAAAATTPARTSSPQPRRRSRLPRRRRRRRVRNRS